MGPSAPSKHPNNEQDHPGENSNRFPAGGLPTGQGLWFRLKVNEKTKDIHLMKCDVNGCTLISLTSMPMCEGNDGVHGLVGG